MTDSSQFEVEVDVPAGGMSAAADAATRLADMLQAAGAASTAATEAVKAGEAAYKTAETTAVRAAAAVEKIGLAADAQRGKLQAAMDLGDTAAADRAAAKLQNLVARQAEAAQKASAATAAMNAEAASLDQLKAAAAAAEKNEAQLVKAEKDQADAAKAAAKAHASQGDAAEGAGVNFRALSGALGKLGGPLGSAGQQAAGFAGGIQKLSKTLGALGPYVAAAVVAVAIAAGFAVATLAIAKFAVTAADAARTSQLLSAGVAGSVAGGKELDDKLQDLASKVPQTRDELLAMAGDLAKTGLKGKALSDALETAAVKAAKLKWGPDFAKQMLSLDSQAARLKAHISGPNGIFSGLNIEGVLGGLAKLVALFDSTSATGKAIKVVFESMFQPVLDGLTSLVPVIVRTFIQFEIWALKALIAIKPYGSKIEMVAKTLAMVAAVILGVVAVALAVLVAASIAFVTVMAFMIENGIALAKALFRVGESVYGFAAAIVGGAIDAVTSFLNTINAAIESITGIDLASIGSSMIDGLVQGITNSAGAILSAMTGAVGGAVDAAKNLLGIHSPSKVFAEIGMNTAAGMAEGVDTGAADVQGSLTAMVAPPDAAGGGGASVTAKSGGNTYQFIIQAGGGDTPSLVAAIREALLDILEGDAIELGAGEPA